MNNQIDHAVDKTNWPNGPWMSEPDRLQWQHAGYACLIVRNKALGNLCGYVGVDRAHPYYGKEYGECDVTVHGGLTYSDKCWGPICHEPEPGMPDDVWWLGFDCAHCNDLVPSALRYSDSRAEGDVYRDLAYVMAETGSLADQLRLVTQSGA